MDTSRFMPMVTALTNAGYAGPQLGTAELQAARAGGGTPIRDWFQTLSPEQRQSIVGGGMGGEMRGGMFGGGGMMGGRFGGRPDRPDPRMERGPGQGELPHADMGFGNGPNFGGSRPGGALSPGGFPAPGYNTGIVPPHMGGSPVPGPTMGHMGPGSGLAPPAGRMAGPPMPPRPMSAPMLPPGFPRPRTPPTTPGGPTPPVGI